MKKVGEGSAPVISGNGTLCMDFINVRGVVEANVLAAESDVGARFLMWEVGINFN